MRRSRILTKLKDATNIAFRTWQAEPTNLYNEHYFNSHQRFYEAYSNKRSSLALTTNLLRALTNANAASSGAKQGYRDILILVEETR
jgi:hypothetical protein